MFDHVTIRASDRDASRQFYALALGDPTHESEWFVEWGDFSLVQGAPTRHLHVGFEAASREDVDAWWQRMTAAGHADDGAPGPRPQYGEAYYGAFVLDLDGNSVEAVHNPPLRGAQIDHLWLRARDVAASRAFWEAVAPVLGITLKHDTPDRIQYVSPTGTFSVVEGEPSENVHLAFPVADNDAVAAFHRAATGAGFRDNGAPGERAVYHPGYYGAFVLDADGTNVEAVCHNR